MRDSKNLCTFAACEKKQEVDPRDAFIGAYTYDAKGSVDFDFGITRYSVPLNNQGTFTISKSGDGNKVVIEGWNDPTDVNNIYTSEPARKVMMDGQIFIFRDDKTYTLTGQEVK